MFFNEKILREGAIALNQDVTITDAEFERKYQHIRDDMLFYAAKGGIDSRKIKVNKRLIFKVLRTYGLIK